MHVVIRGLLAGLAATTLLALLLWINDAVGPLQVLDPATLIATILGEGRGTGWVLLWVVGVVGFGLAMAALVEPGDSRLPWRPALTLSGGGWVATMMGLLPMAGYAPFGLGMGLLVPLLTAAWAALFGAALAVGWSWLPRAPELLQHWKAHALRGATQRP